MTPWCFFDFREMAFKVLGGDLAKRLLGVGVIWPKDSLVLTQPWHQGVFCPNHPNTKESFVQTTPMKYNNKESFVQTKKLEGQNVRNFPHPSRIRWPREPNLVPF